MRVDSIDGNIITGKHGREGVPEVGVQVLQLLSIEVLFRAARCLKNSSKRPIYIGTYLLTYLLIKWVTTFWTDSRCTRVE